jgi:hypothetical protein
MDTYAILSLAGLAAVALLAARSFTESRPTETRARVTPDAVRTSRRRRRRRRSA